MINPSNDVYDDALAIAPSDTVNHDWTFDAILVGGAGNVVVVLVTGQTVTLVGVLAGPRPPVPPPRPGPTRGLPPHDDTPRPPHHRPRGPAKGSLGTSREQPTVPTGGRIVE